MWRQLLFLRVLTKPGYLLSPKKRKRGDASKMGGASIMGEAAKKGVMPLKTALHLKKEREKLINYLVDPYTGKIRGNAQTTTSEFFNTVMQLPGGY